MCSQSGIKQADGDEQPEMADGKSGHTPTSSPRTRTHKPRSRDEAPTSETFFNNHRRGVWVPGSRPGRRVERSRAILKSRPN